MQRFKICVTALLLLETLISCSKGVTWLSADAISERKWLHYKVRNKHGPDLFICIYMFCIYALLYIHICIYTYIHMYIDMYVYRHTFQGVVRPCRGQRTSPAQSDTDSASGGWVLAGRCRGKSQVGLPTAAPMKYPLSTVTVRL